MAQFERLDSPPEQIANVNVVPFIGALCVVIVTPDGADILGGTLEPGESYLDAARRELLEEAGARLLNLRVFGAWKCHASTDRPFRPHLPHPDFYRLAAYGDVELTSEPTNLVDGETIIRVEVVPVAQAAGWFRTINRAELAELYELAAHLRGTGSDVRIRD